MLTQLVLHTSDRGAPALSAAEQDAPAGQTVPQLPQLFGSVAWSAGAVPHLRLPERAARAAVPSLLQTTPSGRRCSVPQWLASDVTHDPPHETYPRRAGAHARLAALTRWQTVPQAPQFWRSVCTFAQFPPHISWPELQVVVTGGGLGAAPDETAGAEGSDKGQERSSYVQAFFRLLMGDSERQPSAGGLTATGTSLRSSDRRDGIGRGGPKCGGYRTQAPSKPQPVFHRRNGRFRRHSGVQTPQFVAARTTRLTPLRQQPTGEPFLGFQATERNH